MSERSLADMLAEFGPALSPALSLALSPALSDGKSLAQELELSANLATDQSLSDGKSALSDGKSALSQQRSAGSKGGRKRADNLSPERRRQIAMLGVEARRRKSVTKQHVAGFVPTFQHD